MPSPPPIRRRTRSLASFGNAVPGLVTVPRRGWDSLSQRIIDAAANTNIEALKHYYRRFPLHILKVRHAQHAYVRMAHLNNAGLMFSPGDVSVAAFDTIQSEDGSATETLSESATERLRQLWQSAPGGLEGFCRALLSQLEWAGMACAEAVPGWRREGVASIHTFDPLTVLFKYNKKTGRFIAYQAPSLDADPVVGDSAAYVDGERKGEVKLDPQTCFLVALDGDSDNLYGVPLFAGALAEVIKDDIQEQNTSDIMAASAYPHTSWGFPFEETMTWAEEHPDVLIGQGENGEDLTPNEYAWREYDRFCELLRNLRADDPIVGPKGLEGKVLESGRGVQALEGVLKMRRHRLVVGLDQLPNMLGITEGGTQAYAREQTRLQSKKLEAYRQVILGIVQKISELHLRLLGMEQRVRIETVAIMPGDRVAEATARQIEAATDKNMVDWGWLDNDEASQKHTGSAAVGSPAQTQDDTDGDGQDGEEEGTGDGND